MGRAAHLVALAALRCRAAAAAAEPIPTAAAAARPVRAALLGGAAFLPVSFACFEKCSPLHRHLAVRGLVPRHHCRHVPLAPRPAARREQRRARRCHQQRCRQR